MDLITIIIPVYNEEQYLEKCLNSAVNQTYKNIEIILIDDGSTDNSFKIYQKYPQIKVYKQKNEGLSSARNKGLELSKGKYIYFLDADDYIEKNTIEIMHKEIIKNKSDLAISNIYESKLKYQNFNITNNQKYNYLYNEFNMITVVSWNKLYKKELFENLRYKKMIHEDEYIITDILQEASKITYINNPLYHYRYVENSLSNNITEKNLDILKAYDHRLETFKDKNLIKQTLKIKFYTLSNLMIKIKLLNKKHYLKILKQTAKEILKYKNSPLQNLRYFTAYKFPSLYLQILKAYKCSKLNTKGVDK